MNKLITLCSILIGMSTGVFAQSTQTHTYCNPINIDYTYMIYNANQDLSYRSGADPAVVKFRNEYYMFVTRSMGYWHSTDLTNWNFIIPKKWYFQGSNAPAAVNYKDSVLYVAGDPSGNMSILYKDNPKKGDWKAVPSILTDLQDPDLFIDDNGQAYMLWGSSNKFPIRMEKLNKDSRFQPGRTDSLFNLKEEMHGWERFCENNTDTVLHGYIEGPWMTKYHGIYYLQYAAPGTEFNVYGDGVYMSDSIQGPYHYAPNAAGEMGKFTGWTLLSYKKPVKASSYLGNYTSDNLVDENIKTFWVAKKNDSLQWIEIDLMKPAKVYAVQVYYNDYHSNLYGRIPELFYRYVIKGSLDRKKKALFC